MHKLKLYFIFCFAFISLEEVFGQASFERTQHDFGSIASADESYTDFKINNSGSRSVYILRAQANENILVKYSSKTIEPGGSAFVRVKYISTQKGSFREKVSLYLSDRNGPQELIVSGNTTYQEYGGNTSCPDFSNSASVNKLSTNVKVEVIDAVTKEKIPQAEVSIYVNPWSMKKFKTNREGEVEKRVNLGFHFFEAQKEGYTPAKKDQNMKMGNNLVVLELTKDGTIEEPQEKLKIIVKDRATGEIIPQTLVELRHKANHKEEDTFVHTTNQRGEVYGPVYEKKDYCLTAKKEGYSSLEHYHPGYFDVRENTMIVFLEKEKEAIVVAEEVEEEEDETAMVEPEPVEELEKPIKDAPEIVNGALSTDVFKPNNIVFLIDKSTSMRQRDRMNTLKTSMLELLKYMRDVDRISLVTYSTTANVELTAIKGSEKEKIAETIFDLEADGLTAGGKGLDKAYEIAEAHFMEDGNNEIFIATDGAFNVGGKGSSLLPMVQKQSKKGIHLSVIGVKNGYVVEDDLKSLAKKGKGTFVKIKDNEETQEKILDVVKDHSRKDF